MTYRDVVYGVWVAVVALGVLAVIVYGIAFAPDLASCHRVPGPHHTTRVVDAWGISCGDER